MEVQIFLPKNATIEIIEREYPDIYEDGDNQHHDLSYFVGKSMDDPEGRRFLTYSQAVECVGFCEGAIPGAETMIEGNGDWAMGMIRRKDFSGLAVSPQQKSACKRTSNLYWKSFKCGQRKAKNLTK